MDRYMTIVHRRDIILGVLARWTEQYRHYDSSKVLGWDKRPLGEIQTALAALDLKTCSQADIDAAIGTSGWAANKCDACDKDCEVLLRLGQEPDYEARYWEICLDCLKRAGRVLRGAKAKDLVP